MIKHLQKYDIWIAGLDPSLGSEPGKIRPVVIIQSDILHELNHSSTIICPISSKYRGELTLLRIAINPSKINGLDKESFIICDQIRSIDNSRLKEKIGRLDVELIERLTESVKLILAL